MVTCSHCGDDIQPGAVYCANCGIPVHSEQGPSYRTGYLSGLSFIIGIVIGLILLGIGIFISLYSADIGMAGSAFVGYAILVIGIVVLIISILMFGRIRT